MTETGTARIVGMERNSTSTTNEASGLKGLVLIAGMGLLVLAMGAFFKCQQFGIETQTFHNYGMLGSVLTGSSIILLFFGFFIIK